MFKQQQQPPSKTDKTTIKQVVDLIQCQDLKFQALTDMVASMMISSKTTERENELQKNSTSQTTS